MNFSCLNSFRISVIKYEAGKSTLSLRTRLAFRIIVRPSAMGSDKAILLPLLPACLDHAGDFTFRGEFSQADPAQFELPIKPSSFSAVLTTVIGACFEFRGAPLLQNQ
jgi:hypothetical protein